MLFIENANLKGVSILIIPKLLTVLAQRTGMLVRVLHPTLPINHSHSALAIEYPLSIKSKPP